MKSIFIVMLLLAFGVNSASDNSNAQVKGSSKKMFIDHGAVTFVSCTSTTAHKLTVSVSHLSGTAPKRLYQFEDGVMITSKSFTATGTTFEVSKTNPGTNTPQIVTFHYLSGGVYYLYAGANIIDPDSSNPGPNLMGDNGCTY